MVKKTIVVIICLVAVGAYAQNGTVSPYSYFGIGHLRSAETVESQTMGGLSMYADSIHVNLRNPAAYSELALTAYVAGLSYKELSLKSFTDKQRTSTTNLDYLSLGFKLKKGFGLGFGLIPYSSVNYVIRSKSKNSNGKTVSNLISGNGGINKVYLSLGYKVFKNFSVGITANYNFGMIENESLQNVEDVQLSIFNKKKSRIGGADFNFAVNYTPPIKDKYTLYTSVIVNSQGNLVSKNSQRTGSVLPETGKDIAADVDLNAEGLKNTDLKIPATTILGIGFGKNKKWLIGMEYSFQALSSFENKFFRKSNLRYKDASTVAFGGYYVPNYASFTSYFKRVTYRAGIKYTESGMVANNKEINNFGITFGVGLPLGGSFSNINLGFELGEKGTIDASLIEESYFKVSVGLSLNDANWFRKRTIN